MENKLAGKYNFISLFKFSFPTIVMMVFMSLYTMVDGIFVSRLVGTDALAAVNIVYPIVSIVIAVGVMLGTGGSAIVALKMGEGKTEQAKQDFTMITLAGVGAGLVIMVIGLIFLEPILHFLGASEAMFELCRQYGFLLLIFTIPAILQMLFQLFFVTAGKPIIGLTVTILGGIANIVLDYFFIAVLEWGIGGAAVATGIGYMIPGLFGLFWFLFNKKGTLFFVRPVRNKGVLLKTLTNGSSEMVTNLSTAIITYLFNVMMMKYLGEDGVAAISIVLYAEYLLVAIYLGYSSGIAPILSYNYGEQNIGQLRRLFWVSIRFLVISSAVIFGGAILLTDVLVGIFAQPGTEVFELAVHGYHLYVFCYMFKGVNIFASSLFTALSDGMTSALLSFMRTLVFILIGMLVLPLFFEVNGIWLAVPFAEGLSILLALFCFARLLKGSWSKRF